MEREIVELDAETRAQLARFVCAMAWADLRVQPEERTYILGLLKRLRLEEDVLVDVEGWLTTPPDPDLIDPYAIPKMARDLFIDEARRVIEADGKIYPEERDMFELFRKILYTE